MTRIIIAGDSWGAHSYESNYNYDNLHGFKWKPKKKYVLYPGPAYFLKDHVDLDVITTADHGVSNTQAFEILSKLYHSNDIVVFYKTGLLREVYKAHLENKNTHKSNDCKADFTYYSNEFYKKCASIKAKHFCLIGGCAKIQTEQAVKYDIPVIEHSITNWLFPDFEDNDFDPTLYWLEYQYSDEYFKQGVIESYDKIDFWNKRPKDFCKKHPTVYTNKKIANRIYEYIKGMLD